MLDFDIRLIYRLNSNFGNSKIQLVLKISFNFDSQSHIDGLHPKFAFEMLLRFRLESIFGKSKTQLVLKILITDRRQFRAIK